MQYIVYIIFYDFFMVVEQQVYNYCTMGPAIVLTLNITIGLWECYVTYLDIGHFQLFWADSQVWV